MRLTRTVVGILTEDHDAHLLKRRRPERVEHVRSGRVDHVLALLLAQEGAQAIVVIGGRYSKNTKELAGIAARAKPTVMVLTADELDPAFFAGMRTVAVTAGASTPDYDVEAVVERLRAMGPVPA